MYLWRLFYQTHIIKPRTFALYSHLEENTAEWSAVARAFQSVIIWALLNTCSHCQIYIFVYYLCS